MPLSHRRTRCLVPIAVLLSLSAACAPGRLGGVVPARAADSVRFERLLEDYLAGPPRAERRQDPLRATLAALASGADRRRAERVTAWLERLGTVDTLRLSVPQRIDWLLLRAQLRRQVYDTVLHAAERTPANYLTVGGIYWRIVGDRPPTAADWMATRRELETQLPVLQLGRAQLHAPPPLWARLADATARSYAAFLRGELTARLAGAPDSLRDTLRALAPRAAEALDAFAVWLRDTLPPGAETAWQSGPVYYDWVLREYHMLPFTADSMIAEGRRWHEATKRALDSVAHALRPGARWQDLAEEMRARHPVPGGIIDAYRRQSHRVQAFLIRDDLIRVPPCQELVFVATPPQLRQTYAWGGYGGLTEREGVQVGRFFVTDVWPGMSPEAEREKLRAQNDGWIAVIALHEGYPGHHLQQAYAVANPRRLRRRSGNTYYGEGWALYAEHWMARAGLFDTPDAQLAQLQMRLWRTARVIIDPSLHTGRMSYEDAVRMFVEEVGLEQSAAEAEVNRFTTWPTQAPSYIIGWLELERLKAELRQELGERFREKDYVEKVLEAGPLPLALLRRAVRNAYGL